ncbi:uncharacterized protein LOC132708848 [Cylas formicarius]|uniref:uncharacterized protein LOC132708848 n=1 Tax=Cylas formicarius TaxID=197179 RepID=UPI0029585134|nr:uncharacterized protein LOC132708848 [Cylas formicarius]
MTSVTIPSSTGPLHGVYSSMREELSNSESDFEAARNQKRCLSLSSSSDTCKKRRKQSTPIRIFVNELGGKQSSEVDMRLGFESTEQVQNHISTEFKREPEEDIAPLASFGETPLCLTMPRTEMQWGADKYNVQNLPFSTANPVFMAMSQFTPPENIQMKPIRIFNPDAYCDLCNKEFCNKYFLKTHKANKHGIYSDIPSTELPSSAAIPFAGNVKHLPSSVPSLDLPVKTEPKPPSNLINPYSAMPIDGPSSSSESDKLNTEDQTNEECSSPSNTQTESTSVKNEFESSYFDSANQSSRETERLKKIGVMNPKAFCEICNKEYCNKYFLRTHKMKRHGIYIPDERDAKFEGMGSHSWPSSVQTSPLNLIMTEQSSLHDRKTTSPNDISCDLCGIRFQNSSLAHLHNLTVHGKMAAKEVADNPDVSSEESKKTLNTEAISEDLQKLQTMIMQLNELDVTKVSTSCATCNKEFENRFYLHAHMVTEHGMLLDDVTDFDKGGDSENSNNNTMCDLCGKDLQNAEEMKKHILDAHSNAEGSKEEEFTAPDKGGRIFNHVPERRLSVNVTPTSSYCEICNKELCNKYFMKTHMQRMHGIEIENGAQIGGVVCDICNKELCSKYFLRVHKHNTHGIVEYGASLLQPRKVEGEPPPVQEPDPALKPGDLADLSHRYFTHFTEVCPICSRRFRSTKWLKAHLISDHGQTGVEKWTELEQQLQQSLAQTGKISKAIKTERSSPNLKIPNGGQEFPPPKKVGIQNVLSSIFGSDEVNTKTYQCSYCPFTSPLLPLLFIHERSHTLCGADNVPIKCPVCPQSFLERELFQRHMFTQHPFLPLPPLFNGTNHSELPTQENLEEESSSTKQTKTPTKSSVTELPLEVSQSLKDVAKKVQLPTTYALPQQSPEVGQEDNATGSSGYVMQAFLLEDSTSERRVFPSVVFLPMLQKQPAPLTVTFTLTPA